MGSLVSSSFRVAKGPRSDGLASLQLFGVLIIHIGSLEAMGIGMSARRRSRSKGRSRRSSMASDETSGTLGTRGTNKSTRSARSASSNTSKSSANSKGSARRRRLKEAIEKAKGEAKELAIVPKVGGHCSVVLEDVGEGDSEYEVPDNRAWIVEMPVSHPFAVAEEPE